MHLAAMPAEVLRELYEAFRIKITYERDGRKAHFSAEIPAETVGELADLVDRRAQICCVPPAGFEPALSPPEGDALSPELRGLGADPTLAAAARRPRTRFGG